MSKKEFTINDLKSGYVVETRDGSRYLVTRVNQNNFIKVIVNANRSFGIGCFNTDLTYVERSKKHDIVKVWGLSNDPLLAVCIHDVSGRPLLWKRREFLNCKICITETYCLCSNFTIGKIYEIKDGYFKNDIGETYPVSHEPISSVKELTNYLNVKFVVIVED